MADTNTLRFRDSVMCEAIANAATARRNCIKANNVEWLDRWTAQLEALAELLPSGSGFDSGSHIDMDRTTEDKLVLTTSFHHMAESGMYDGWTEHTVTVRASFVGRFSVSVSGRNRNDIKEYISECFSSALSDAVRCYEDNSVRLVRWAEHLARIEADGTAK